MVKRRISCKEDGVPQQPIKRLRATPSADRLSTLSHELLLRVLTFLEVGDLVTCHRLSEEFNSLSSDPQLWKAHYYNRFVRPRASRIPGIRESAASANSLHFSSRISKWLDDESLIKGDKETNWKRQYKLRHNWSRGTCAVSEVPLAEQSSVPPILVQMHDSIIYMADHVDGLRAWNKSAKQNMLARTPWNGNDSRRTSSPPTALAVDTYAHAAHKSRITVGFQDGSFGMYELDSKKAIFTHMYSHAPSSNGMLTAIAMSSPYLATMTANQLLSVYKFEDLEDLTRDTLKPPRLLHSLHSHTVWPPLTLSIRPSSDSVLISTAYALPTYLSGWTVGIQEMRLSLSGALLASRLASAIDQHYRPLTFTGSPSLPPSPVGNSTIRPSLDRGSEALQIHSKPTSLSYTHPYLLVSHPDNTLTLYLVTSTKDTLSISPGNRLWGHTSSVSGAHVGGRGRAVSVTARGDELRVWELEGGFDTRASRRRLERGGVSVRVIPDQEGPRASPASGASNQMAANDRKSARHSDVPGLGLGLEPGLGLASGVARDCRREFGRGVGVGGVDVDAGGLSRGWIGFDEENVIVLRESLVGSGASGAAGGGSKLVVYDFA